MANECHVYKTGSGSGGARIDVWIVDTVTAANNKQIIKDGRFDVNIYNALAAGEKTAFDDSACTLSAIRSAAFNARTKIST